MSDREYVAVGPKAWGRGEHETEAVKEMAKNLPNLDGPYSPDGNTIEFTVFEVSGFEGVNQMSGAVRAEEVHDKTPLRAFKDAFRELDDVLTRVEILAESIYVESEEIEE